LLSHRLAAEADIPALTALAAAAIDVHLAAVLTPAQLAASRQLMGLDSQLIADRTYFVVEENGQLAGCGGWSRRATPYGGDHSPGRDAGPLDPATDAAKVRAMYTAPGFERRGVARLILSVCETAAKDAGFARVELTATMSGQPLYEACGYTALEAFHDARAGEPVPLLLMGKAL
jgi:GNAT superfamily N-acetyltransferase